MKSWLDSCPLYILLVGSSCIFICPYTFSYHINTGIFPSEKSFVRASRTHTWKHSAFAEFDTWDLTRHGC